MTKTKPPLLLPAAFCSALARLAVPNLLLNLLRIAGGVVKNSSRQEVEIIKRIASPLDAL